MRIKPFSLLTRTSVHALRHYEAIGLLVPQRLPGNGYRDYAPEQVREAVFITMSRQVGIGLALISEQLPRYRAGRLRPADMVEALHARRDELDAQIQALQAQRKTVVDHATWVEEQARQARARRNPQKPWPATPKRRPMGGIR
jgi:MerR family transcriptional regulator, copper efflux regulator